MMISTYYSPYKLLMYQIQNAIKARDKQLQISLLRKMEGLIEQIPENPGLVLEILD